MTHLELLFVEPGVAIRDVIAHIDRNAQGIALVVDDRRRLIATVTDGDVRRAVLAHVDVDAPLSALLEIKAIEDPDPPLTAPVGTPVTELLHRMNERRLRHIPLLDVEGRVVELATLAELAREYELPLNAVVMAGGFGLRLRPLTDETPKPMLPVGGRPLLEHIVEQLRSCGIRRVSMTTHFRPEVISGHFGDGSEFGVEIDYLNEEEPLGTAGALSLVQDSEEPLLVINGDVLTRVDFRAMLDFHREQDATMTVAVRQEEQQLPFGVVSTDGVLITGIEEKPVLRHFINAGIYLLAPEARREVPPDTHFDMTDLMAKLIRDGLRVVGFPVREYWLDIGHTVSYGQAESDHKAGRLRS